jgi:uncharacterized SAM-binding protein YcdF (DUF218 family)
MGSTWRGRSWGRWIAGLVLFLGIGAAGFWVRWVDAQIKICAVEDQAAPADAIVVFGAAQYDGRPSLAFRARLDHALALYRRGLAPLLITLGGEGGDADQFSEGEVGKSYLMGTGVDEDEIIAETHSRNTEDSVRRLAVIARANHLHRLIVVSDATHLFRLRALCAAHGLNVLTSPRPRVPVEGYSGELARTVHEIASYTLWRLHLH